MEPKRGASVHLFYQSFEKAFGGPTFVSKSNYERESHGIENRPFVNDFPFGAQKSVVASARELRRGPLGLAYGLNSLPSYRASPMKRSVPVAIQRPAAPAGAAIISCDRPPRLPCPQSAQGEPICAGSPCFLSYWSDQLSIRRGRRSNLLNTEPTSVCRHPRARRSPSPERIPLWCSNAG